jgi:uncharacterized membrane protein YedE/YeeE
MANYSVALLSGLIFGFGLALSGMTHTEVVLGFLDVADAWNPSLLFVLGGAVSVTVTSFYFIRKRTKPVLTEKFIITDSQQIDRPLIVGSALFGLGWGISGYCPGPAVALLATPNWELWVFLPALLLGNVLHGVISSRNANKGTTNATPSTQSEQPTCG